MRQGPGRGLVRRKEEFRGEEIDRMMKRKRRRRS